MAPRERKSGQRLQTSQMSTQAPIPKEEPGDEPDDVLFNPLYGVRLIELNRPQKLNSLNGSMARKIIPRLKVLYLSILNVLTRAMPFSK